MKPSGRRPTLLHCARPRRMIAVILLIALLPACQVTPAQIYIPLAYGLTGLCIALLVSPSLMSACIGLSIGAVIGAAVYNNSLKRDLLHKDRPPQGPVPAKP